MNDYTRRQFLKTVGIGVASIAVSGQLFSCRKSIRKPNILFCISDDQSWLHVGAYGDRVVKTPNIDRIADNGALFTNAYCAAPSCTPSRASILTGQNIWRLEEGGNLWSTLPAKFPIYTDLLMESGYHVGFMGKGWGPGKFEPGGRTHNPAGPQKYENFSEFRKAAPEGKPWCFWFGSHDPHRGYELGSGVASGMKLKDVFVPPVFPDVPEIRSDICDYYFEIQRYDREIGEILQIIEKTNQFDNTMVVITSDNGMPFPRCKPNLYDLSTRMPLVISWANQIPGGRVIDDLISLTDLAPTFLETAGLDIPQEMTGNSLFELLISNKSGILDPNRDNVFTARERHGGSAREGCLGYPARAIRTREFLYIRNYNPERWPAGDPDRFWDMDGAPTKVYMIKHRDDPDVEYLFNLAFGKRPAEELYELKNDPYQMNNVADNPEFATIKKDISMRLTEYLKKTGDPRALGKKPKWDDYPYYGAY